MSIRENYAMGGNRDTVDIFVDVRQDSFESGVGM